MTNEEKESRLEAKDSNDPITILIGALLMLPMLPRGKDLFATVKLERAISYLNGDESNPRRVLADRIDVLPCPACSSLQAHQEILSSPAVGEGKDLHQPFECQNCGGVGYFNFESRDK